MWNTAIGDEALYSTTTGTLNTAIGGRARITIQQGAVLLLLDGQHFIASTVEKEILLLVCQLFMQMPPVMITLPLVINRWPTTGRDNTGVVCRLNTSGEANTAIGRYAMYNNTTGGYNAALGANACRQRVGVDNTAVGNAALYNNTTGGGNTARVKRYGICWHSQ